MKRRIIVRKGNYVKELASLCLVRRKVDAGRGSNLLWPEVELPELLPENWVSISILLRFQFISAREGASQKSRWFWLKGWLGLLKMIINTMLMESVWTFAHTEVERRCSLQMSLQYNAMQNPLKYNTTQNICKAKQNTTLQWMSLHCSRPFPLPSFDEAWLQLPFNFHTRSPLVKGGKEEKIGMWNCMGFEIYTNCWLGKKVNHNAREGRGCTWTKLVVLFTLEHFWLTSQPFWQVTIGFPRWQEASSRPSLLPPFFKLYKVIRYNTIRYNTSSFPQVIQCNTIQYLSSCYQAAPPGSAPYPWENFPSSQSLSPTCLLQYVAFCQWPGQWYCGIVTCCSKLRFANVSAIVGGGQGVGMRCQKANLVLI